MTGVTKTPIIHRREHVNTDNRTDRIDNVRRDNNENNNNNNENNIDTSKNNNDKYENNNDNNENNNKKYNDSDTVMAVTDDVIDVTENVTAVTLSSVKNNNLRPRSFAFLTDKNKNTHVDDSTKKDVEKLSENENNGTTMVNNCNNNGNNNGTTMVNNWQNNGKNNGLPQHHAHAGNDQVHMDDNECTSTINIADVVEDADDAVNEDARRLIDEINQTNDEIMTKLKR